ncbi:MAG: amidohydrolase family protein [Candidatus Omnitrophota bacterium]
MLKIIDSHSHCIPLEVAQKTAFFKVGWSDADKQLAAMDEQGIARSLLLYPTSDAHIQMGGWKNLAEAYNAGIAKIVKQHSDRFIGAGILAIDNEKNLSESLKQFSDYGFPVISLASSYEGKYLDEGIFFAVYEYAAAKKIPIHIHPQIMNPIGEDRVRDPLLSPVLEYVFDVSMCIGKLMMSGTFLKFPSVKFIFAHYGGVLPLVKERFDNTYLMLRKREFVKDLGKVPSEYLKNIYFDTSGSKSLASLLCALEVTDASHILWGSDHPANQNTKASIDAILASQISSSDKEKILSQNILSLLSRS